MTLKTEFVYPPIPIRSFDWSAYDDDDCMCSECHPTIGYGETKQAAVADYLDQIAEAELGNEQPTGSEQ